MGKPCRKKEQRHRLYRHPITRQYYKCYTQEQLDAKNHPQHLLLWIPQPGAHPVIEAKNQRYQRNRPHQPAARMRMRKIGYQKVIQLDADQPQFLLRVGLDPFNRFLTMVHSCAQLVLGCACTTTHFVRQAVFPSRCPGWQATDRAHCPLPLRDARAENESHPPYLTAACHRCPRYEPPRALYMP